MENKSFIVSDNENNMRLDRVVSMRYLDLSRVMIQKMVQEGKILINEKKQKASYKVSSGETIQIEQIEIKEATLEAQNIMLDILYEDDDILVVNKEKGMVVHPGNGNPDNTLANAILGKCKDSLPTIGGKIRPGIVHRLDKDTSGVIIVAKNDVSHINLSKQIKERTVKKTYIALVRGVIKENFGTVNMPIGRSTKDRKKMAIIRSGKEAITHFEVIKRYEKYTLLKINIETGRTHQIRVHLSEIGYPIIGDSVYSNGKNPFNVVGQMLHAQIIEFNHPKTEDRIRIEAPIPEYFKKVIEQLDNEKE